jgi:hypothetical protein
LGGKGRRQEFGKRDKGDCVWTRGTRGMGRVEKMGRIGKVEKMGKIDLTASPTPHTTFPIPYLLTPDS